MTRIRMILIFAGFVGGCDAKTFVRPCEESVCHPSWLFDCRCYGGAKMEALPNGNVVCRCSK